MDACECTRNSQRQSTQRMSNPCSYRIQILQARKHGREFVKSRSISHENQSGDPLFSFLQYFVRVDRKRQGKNEKILGRTFVLNKNVLFSTFAKNPLHRIFLKSLCIFLFTLGKKVVKIGQKIGWGRDRHKDFWSSWGYNFLSFKAMTLKLIRATIVDSRKILEQAFCSSRVT